ncbi:methionine--tRNA ligase [Candidatus Synchoanobacter obligatus]|uniref:Methionine--tRNA ligase n=1 Tax=Candidatus Synchoanobacter obligatus TaxID=2919597 RepID=A0ABT1L4Q9_9GAMM|nr:methionine--tRNA ligase [Candidatus Synchoanobacter obligatus]MCP8352164.1 methionine--tRNA ligase [Candidatus Synchoanobacter obligatus]
MTNNKRVVTYALPYANGMLHLGHIMGMVQVDCYVRSLRMQNIDVTFVCGDDAHGTPIMLNAMKQGISPEQLIGQFYKEHVQDVRGFAISFDGYHTTHSMLNTQIVHQVYHRLNQGNMIVQKSIQQAYDVDQEMFLPDRYIKGECPKCGAQDQYGDHCEVCGKTYAIKDLKSPVSIMSNTSPVWKESLHDFFRLSSEQGSVEQWLSGSDIQESVKNKLGEWFVEGLQDWDITRDAPYFGIEIPNQPNKYFYVWLDAPFGYLSALGATLGLAEPQAIFDVWNDLNIEHFIGKDIVCFHGVFWPAVLKKAGLKAPSKLHVHGFLTLAGDKMSKSRGRFVSTRDYLAKLPADMLRYYFASRLSTTVADVDLDWQDFVLKVNADLVGKLANIGSRSQGFVHKYHEGCLGSRVDEDFWQTLISRHEEIMASYQAVNLAQVCRLVMELCDETNQYVDHHKPWVLAKEGDQEQLLLVATTALAAFRYLVYLLAPIIPNTAEKVAEAMGESQPVLQLDPFVGMKVNKFGHLLSRVVKEDVAFE